MGKSERVGTYDMLVRQKNKSVEHILRLLKKIGVPDDGRWQTLILYLRYISDYSYLTNTQKEKIQNLLLEIIKKKKFDKEEYNRIINEVGNIFFEPYKEKIKETLKETTELLKKFAEISSLRKKNIKNLQKQTINIIEESDDIESAITKIKESFKKVIDFIDNDIKELYKEIHRDALTSLYNRRFLDMYLDKILIKCQKNKMPCCVLMFDIDDFKDINDKYGHRIGDQALKMVATIITREGKEFVKEKGYGNFFATRYGGEEFCVVMEGFDSKEGYEFAEIVRIEVEKYNFIIRDVSGNVVETSNIKISGGVSSTYRGNTTKEILIEEADQALYKAKRKGKHRIEVTENNV